LTYIGQPAMPAALDSGAIQGFFASAPFWMQPVAKGTGVAWIVGPSGEIPSEFNPVAANLLLTMREYAQANPDLIKSINSALTDAGAAVSQRPAEAIAVVAKIFPDLDKRVIELFVQAEANAWKVKAPTASDMAREIDFLKMSGMSMPPPETLKPASMIFP
jgi:ABC-type nitrate/sulfonate/bicarbonate transport system substrate-binding protein